MSVILGIDLGTSSVKAMLLDCESKKTAVAAKKYEVDIPIMNYAQQSPEVWWSSVKTILNQLKNTYPVMFEAVEAVGFSGQMHGLVMIDQEGEPLRPAIVWLDQRSRKELEEIESNISMDEMGRIFCNRVFTGFAFPSLLWVKENEKEVFEKTAHILMPKDYIRMRMTGNVGTEMSDASSSAIFNTAERQWAWEIIHRFGLPEEIFPSCHEASEIAGYITEKCMEETGLKAGIPVVYGAGDQPAQSIGNGCVNPGTIISNIGTGGQISTYTERPVYDKQLRTHTFCHAIHSGYTVMGATLCSGMSLSWLKDKVLKAEDFTKLSKMAGEAGAGSKGLIFLPYLSGERTPHMNSAAKGMFFGLTLSHTRNHFVRAVMEGVAFSLKDSLMIFEELGISGDTIIASGGGASSDEWLQIQADIFEKNIKVCGVREQACLGACILAGVGTGIFSSIEQACERFVSFRDKVYEPNEKNIETYRELYRKYGRLYEKNVDLMNE